jgi:hypothetical protein
LRLDEADLDADGIEPKVVQEATVMGNLVVKPRRAFR